MYATVFSPCAICHLPFGFNPHAVPSIRINDVKEPICRSCMDKANAMRKEKGLPEFPIRPDAYEPIHESQL